MLFLGGRLPKAQYDDPGSILEQEELDDDEMQDFINDRNRSNSNNGRKQHQQTMQSAKLSPANSLNGLKITIGDPTNKSVIDDNFKDNDSLHQMGNHQKIKSNRVIRPIAGAQSAAKAILDPELDQISTIQMHNQGQESTKDSTADKIDLNNKLRQKTKAQQAAAMQKQRALIQDMSKNI